MRVATFNVNGIRAATRRGFSDWLERTAPDILALQEVRCPEAQLPDVFSDLHFCYHQGNLAGRNGVALLTREKPTAVRTGFGHSSDTEGRYIEIDLPGLRVASLYLPKGGVLDEDEASAARYHRKMDFMAAFIDFVEQSANNALADGLEYLVMGDFNIAHTKNDLKNWRGNQTSDGFLPEEREWFTKLLQLTPAGSDRPIVDVVRQLNPDAAGPYSWWTWRGQAFMNDAGWRIDYQIATPALAERATRGWTDKELTYESRISDHAPVLVDYS